MAHFTKVELEGIRAIDSSVYRLEEKRIAIQPARINVMIGENGSGKSTVLDAIHALSSAEKLCGLKTENAADDTPAKCTYERGSDLLTIFFCKDGEDDFNSQNFVASVNGRLLTSDWLKIPKVGRTDANLTKAISLLAPYGKDIVYVDGNTPPNNDGVIADELNRLGPLLIGLASELDPATHADAFDKDKINEPISYSSQYNKFDVYLKSDLVQPSLVPLSHFPAGWIRYATICQAIVSANNGAVILLDEPEIHLHPKLQHKLMQRIYELASEGEKDLQIFIATHSNVFINQKRWSEGEVKIYEIKDKEIAEVKTSRDVLERLGFKASDLLQTDGIIWVEGPSDRLYIEHWLDIWCEEIGKKRPAENVNYSYSFYGGSILSHFQAGGTADLVDLLMINRNVYMVIDNDHEFTFNDFGDPVPVKNGCVKKQMYDDVKAAGGTAWITKGYTIESYLVSTFRDIYFEDKSGKLVLRDGQRKVVAAQKYPKKNFTANERLGIDDLRVRIGELYDCIETWSTH